MTGQGEKKEGECLDLFNSVSFLICTFRASCYSTRLSWAHTQIINCLLLLVLTLLEVSEREDGIVALHLPIGPL